MPARRRSWMKTGALVAGCLSVCLAAIALLSVGVFLLTRPQSTENLIPALSSPVQVSLLHPRPSTSFPADSFIPVNALARSSTDIAEMELWINGLRKEIQQQGSTGASLMLAEWSWQPVESGTYSLQVRATDDDGRTGISDPVWIEVGPASGARRLITAQAGDTIASLADQYGITPEALVRANPKWGFQPESQEGDQPGDPPEPVDFHAPLSSGSTVFIALDPILPSFPVQSAEEPPATPIPNEGSEPTQPGSGDPLAWDILWFQVRKSLSPSSDLPAAPTLEKYQDWPEDDPCIAKIRVWRNEKNEDGYFVYRWVEGGGGPERVATLPKPPSEDPSSFFRESDPVSGHLTYMVSAFTTAGESFSAPLAYDMSACNFAPIGSRYASEETTTGGVGLAEGYLTVPASVDLAYLYIGINGTFWDRVPPGSNNFLSGSGYVFNLNSYLGDLIDILPDPDLEITIEVWGWQNGTVGKIGAYHAKIHRSVLAVCSEQGKNRCHGTSGNAPWSDETFLPDTPSIEDQNFDIHAVFSPVMDIAERRMVVSYHPFNGPGMMDVQGGHGVIAIHSLSGTEYSSLPLKRYYNDQPVTTGSWTGTEYAANVLKEIFPPGTPFDLYIRVFPMDEHGNVGVPSNTIILHYKTPPKGPESYPLGSTLPSLFSVDIQEDTYQPPSFINPANWGCVIVQNNASGYQAGQVICPPEEPSQPGNWDAGSVLSGEADLAASGMTWLSEQFEAVKDAIVDELAGVIPGCGNTCKAMLKQGLEIGITALTGLPPSLPNFDELSSQGILYVVDQVQSSLTGYECGDACVTLLQNKLASMVAEARRMESQPGCTAHEDVARYYGKQAGWCLPPGVIVEPYPGGSNQSGVVFVRVTRNNTPAPPGDYREWYFLDILTEGINPSRTGTFGMECRYYPDGYQPVDPDGYYKEGGVTKFWQDPYSGQLYNKFRVPMPSLQPGESTLIPIPLQPIGHDHTKDTYIPLVGCDGFAGFKYLFYKGTSRFTASEFCYIKESDSLAYCGGGGQDIFETANPSDPSDQW